MTKLKPSKTDELKAKILPKVVGFGINILSYLAPKTAALKAIDIFRTPRGGRIKSHQRKFLAKFRHRTLQAGVNSVMTYDNGKSGEIVLLCHGWESNSYRWRRLYKELNKTDKRVILMDAPCHGASGSEKFDALLYAEMIDAVVKHYSPSAIVGHSVGAYATLYFMGTVHPASVEKLIILASPDKLEDISTRYFDKVGYNQRVRRYYRQAVEDVWDRPMEEFTVAKYAKSITIPGLIIHDKKDLINLYYEGEAIHNNWPHSTLYTTHGLGHSLQDPEVYQQIINFLG